MSNEADTLIATIEFVIDDPWDPNSRHYEITELNWGDPLPGDGDFINFDDVRYVVRKTEHYYKRRLNGRLELSRMEVYLERA